jgi:uncharacterized protein YhfF
MNLSPRARAFWESYAAAQMREGRPVPQLYDKMVIGADEASADAGAELIRAGRKTATSALPSDFDGAGQRLPRPGDLSLVLDGRGDPVCIVQTVLVETRPLCEVDPSFARDYGEWDGTLATWRDRMLAYHAGRLMSDSLATPLVCERFIRVWPEPSSP